MSTAGESHGPYEVCILEGVPAGLPVAPGDIDAELARRQRGYGRGARMALEPDRCEIVAGVRLGVTIGSPIAVLVANQDHVNWLAEMSIGPRERGSEGEIQKARAVPRPGHADFAGMAKYGHREIRPVLERASARETVARVAGGAVCKRLLREVGVSVRGRVVRIGGVEAASQADYARVESVDWEAVEASAVACDQAQATDEMCRAVDEAREAGESLGGVFEVWCWGVCPGLGSHVAFPERLDGRLLGALGSIPAIKGVEVAGAFADAGLSGSSVHDAFALRKAGGSRWVTRATNRAGGLEGGMTNGMPVVLRAAMKPIPTLSRPLMSVDLNTLEQSPAHVERSDVTAVPAAMVVGEAMVAYVMAAAYVDKFGGDSVAELTSRVATYLGGLGERGLWLHS
jgi:chorismate synthase